MRIYWLLLVACGSHDKPTDDLDSGPDRRDVPRLAAYLREVVAMDDAAKRHEVEGWKLDEAAFKRAVKPAYLRLYPDYARAFDAHVPELVAALHGEVATRAHYAGDNKLTHVQARARWALAIEFPTEVADVGGKPLDTVFVPGKHFGALAGLDDAVQALVRGRDPACAAYLEPAGVPGRCNDIGWEIVDAALRDSAGDFEHACRLADTMCK